MAIDPSSYAKVRTVFQYEATLFDGVSTVATVSKRVDPASYNTNTLDDPNGVDTALQDTVGNFTATGKDYDGWVIVEISVWPATYVTQ